MWQLGPSPHSRSEPCLPPNNASQSFLSRTPEVQKKGLAKLGISKPTLHIPKPTRQNRATLSLRGAGFLRGIHSDILLERCGHRLSGTAGGIGVSREDHAELEYERSHEVEELDVFLSHSWHAPWKRKFLALLLYFNFWPAVIIYLAFNISCAVTMRIAGVTCDQIEPRRSSSHQCQILKIGLQLIGAPVFFVGLFTWHHLVCHNRRTIFLDKVCIHQTDEARKTKGIKSIGAFLAKTKLLLVAWDQSYFKRLWCAFELSAYIYSHPNPLIKVLPVELCIFKLSFVMLSLFGKVWPYFVYKWIHEEQSAMLGNYVVSSLILSIMVPGVRSFMRNRENLHSQLEVFSVRDAKCFCCDQNHVHPETGATLPCDRELVYASIKHWHGGPTDESADVALDEFDSRIRSSLAVRTKQAGLGISYTFAMATGTFRAIHKIAAIILYSARNGAWPSWDRFAVWVVNMCLDVFVARPLVLALTCILSRAFKESLPSRASEICLNIFIGFVSEAGQCLVASFNIFSHTFKNDVGLWFVFLLRVVLLLSAGIPLKKFAYAVPDHEDILRKTSTEATDTGTVTGWVSEDPDSPGPALRTIFSEQVRTVTSEQVPHWSYPMMKQATSDFEVVSSSSVLHMVPSPSALSSLPEKSEKTTRGGSIESELELEAVAIWH